MSKKRGGFCGVTTLIFCIFGIPPPATYDSRGSMQPSKGGAEADAGHVSGALAVTCNVRRGPRRGGTVTCNVGQSSLPLRITGGPPRPGRGGGLRPHLERFDNPGPSSFRMAGGSARMGASIASATYAVIPCRLRVAAAQQSVVTGLEDFVAVSASDGSFASRFPS
jgi:hypothetical protein